MGAKIFHMKHDFISTVEWGKMLLKFLSYYVHLDYGIWVVTLLQVFILY